jgi:ribonuclease P protein subunit POP4
MEYTSLSDKLDLNFTKTFVNSFSSQFEEKVQDKFLSLDSCKTKRKRLNCKSYKNLGINSIPRDMIKYNLYLEMNQLWTSYAIQVKDLLKLEIVGAKLSVLESKNTNVVGLEGICIRETVNIFYIVTESDALLKIPKVNTIFSIRLQDSLIKIYGNNYRFRAADRSNKRVKHVSSIELF